MLRWDVSKIYSRAPLLKDVRKSISNYLRNDFFVLILKWCRDLKRDKNFIFHFGDEWLVIEGPEPAVRNTWFWRIVGEQRTFRLHWLGYGSIKISYRINRTNSSLAAFLWRSLR